MRKDEQGRLMGVRIPDHIDITADPGLRRAGPHSGQQRHRLR